MIATEVKEKLDSITDAINDIRAGKVVIVVDDEDRENEGDFLTAARNVTPEVINFMSKHGRGLICAAVTEKRCEELGLEMMVSKSTDPKGTAFTVSVDLLGYGCTTGISAQDRAKTVQALINPGIRPEEFGRPGHIFPLKAKNGGVLRRAGHTEATVDLALLAGMEPAGVLVEIMNDDGTMARLPQLMEIAAHFDLKIISIKDLIAYRMKTEILVEKTSEMTIITAFGEFNMISFRELIDQKEHFALTRGIWQEGDSVAVRVHSCNMLADIFSAEQNGQSDMLKKAMKEIDRLGKGAIVYMNHLRMNHGLSEEMAELQSFAATADKGVNNSTDARDYGIGAQILRKLGITKMHLLTNHPVKRTGIIGYGLEITGSSPLGS
jgi:3,4-dihydroxy 2-butanone 4-phosphate synthase / GTP cyclohydrolase II